MRRIESTLIEVDFPEPRFGGNRTPSRLTLSRLGCENRTGSQPEEASLETVHLAEILQESLFRREETLKQRGEQVPYAVSIREALVINDSRCATGGLSQFVALLAS